MVDFTEAYFKPFGYFYVGLIGVAGLYFFLFRATGKVSRTMTRRICWIVYFLFNLYFFCALIIYRIERGFGFAPFDFFRAFFALWPAQLIILPCAYGIWGIAEGRGFIRGGKSIFPKVRDD